MKRASLVALTAVCLCGSLAAQERVMNANAPGMLRQWPEHGKWITALFRRPNRSLFCVMVTGYKSIQSEETYFWGLAQDNRSYEVLISDKNGAAVAGDYITVVIDGTQIGTFAVTKRKSNGGQNGISSDLNDQEAQKIRLLLNVAGEIKFATSSATYSSSLDGAVNSSKDFDRCGVERRTMDPPD